MDLLGMLGNHGNNQMISILLPVLLGAKGSGGDLSGVLSAIAGLGSSGSTQGSAKGDGTFPPLFASDSIISSSVGNMMPLLQNILGGREIKGNPVNKNIQTESESFPNYPYELQYNRPDNSKKL